jgi:hypothetical protein
VCTYGQTWPADGDIPLGDWFDGSVHLQLRAPARTTANPAAAAARARAAPLHELQRLAGNRAVTQLVSVQRRGPTPTAYHPDEPLVNNELGATVKRGGQLPDWKVEQHAGATKGEVAGRVATTTTGHVDIDARYVAPGVHEMTPAANGFKRQLLVTDKVAALAKQGEQEHSDDLWWGHQVVAGDAAKAVNKVAAGGERSAPDKSSLQHAFRDSLHSEMSPKLRVTADASDPAAGGSVKTPWFHAVAALAQSTLERDDLGWHSMKSRQATAQERSSHHISDDIYLMVATPGGEIGAHPAEARIHGAYAALADQP